LDGAAAAAQTAGMAVSVAGATSSSAAWVTRLAGCGLDTVEVRDDTTAGLPRWAADRAANRGGGGHWLLIVRDAAVARYLGAVIGAETGTAVAVRALRTRGWSAIVLPAEATATGLETALDSSAAIAVGGVILLALVSRSGAETIGDTIVGGVDELLQRSQAAIVLDQQRGWGAVAARSGGATAEHLPVAAVSRSRRPGPLALVAAVCAAAVIATAAVAVGRAGPSPAAPPISTGLASAPPLSPPPRGNPAVAFDASRAQTVLFGGFLAGSGTILGDTWTLQAGRWVGHATVPSPPPRVSGALVYNPGTRTTQLLGGYGPGGEGPLADEWSWDGNRWHELRPASASGAPLPALLPSAAWDPATHQLVLVCVCRTGDVNDGHPYAAETWTWNQDELLWQQQRPAHHPRLRTSVALAYHRASGAVVLVDSGADPGSGAGDTWAWDGTDWTELAGPQPRYDPLSAHLLEDPATGVLVLTAQPGHTWTWNGALWMDELPAAMPAVHTALVSDGTSLTLLGGPTIAAGLSERWTWLHGTWHITTRVTRSDGPLHS